MHRKNLTLQEVIGNIDWWKCGCECKPMATLAESFCLLLRLKSRNVRGASRHAAFMDNCSTISHLIYLVDKFPFLFLVYLNKMITLGESKVLFLFSGVKQGNERGRLVQNFLVLTQGFGSFPTVFSRAKWRNFARVECL